VQLTYVDLMVNDDEETRQAFYFIKSRAIVPPLVMVNRRLSLYGGLDEDSIKQIINRELERAGKLDPLSCKSNQEAAVSASGTISWSSAHRTPPGKD
jgi:hypothetical protein